MILSNILPIAVLDDNLFYPEWKANQKFYENLVGKAIKIMQFSIILSYSLPP